MYESWRLELLLLLLLSSEEEEVVGGRITAHDLTCLLVFKSRLKFVKDL